jgi:hypothetical protein
MHSTRLICPLPDSSANFPRSFPHAAAPSSGEPAIFSVTSASMPRETTGLLSSSTLARPLMQEAFQAGESNDGEGRQAGSWGHVDSCRRPSVSDRTAQRTLLRQDETTPACTAPRSPRWGWGRRSSLASLRRGGVPLPRHRSQASPNAVGSPEPLGQMQPKARRLAGLAVLRLRAATRLEARMPRHLQSDSSLEAVSAAFGSAPG